MVEDRHKSFIFADEHIQPDSQERASQVCQSLLLNNWCVLYLKCYCKPLNNKQKSLYNI